MKTLTKIIITLALATMAYGQTILSSTTLGAAITSATQTTITLASTSTMQNAGTQNNPNTVLYVDRELMFVTSVVDSTHAIVQRAKGIGAAGRPVTHANAATVYFSLTSGPNPAASFFSTLQPDAETFGSCTSSQLLVLPRVYEFSGHIFDCMGGHWVQTNAPSTPVLGSVVASVAGVITPTGTVFHISGALAITGIALPRGWAPGMSIYVIPDGTFTWTAAGNISLLGTAVVNKTIIFTWDGTQDRKSVV